jgi:hypothetical protein
MPAVGVWDGLMRSRGRAGPQVGAKGIDGVGRFILGRVRSARCWCR